MVYCGSRICGRTLTVIAMAYAIFKTGGKQYRVQTGDVIDVECINTLEEGAEASFDQVLMVENDGKVTVGTPWWKELRSPPRWSASSAAKDHRFQI